MGLAVRSRVPDQEVKNKKNWVHLNYGLERKVELAALNELF